MNKQELICELNNQKDRPTVNYFTPEKREGYQEGMRIAKFIAEKLDEPQKVKVPEVVGKDLDGFTKARLKEDLVKDICLAVYDYSQGTPFDTSTVNWCRKGSNLRTMIDAIWNGYEVEEEPKWVVLGKRGYLTSLSIGKGKSTGWTGNNDKHGSGAIHFDDKEMAQYTAYIAGGEIEKV